MPNRYKIKIAYDGTHYSGWQVQPKQVTIQGEIEKIIKEMTQQKKFRLESSGRTDTGVHAREQVAHFDLNNPIKDCPYFLRGLNAQLNRDIRINTLTPVSSDFHARFSAIGKEYRFFVYNGKILPPHKRLYCLHEARPLDLQRMQTAAKLLEGTHDFAPFAVNRRVPIKSTVRTIYTLSISKHGNYFTFRVHGNGFLYKMVRSLAGFLIHVGIGQLDPQSALEILAHKKRTAKVQSAQPHGLFLWNVFY